jgi:hypothetical protein
VVNQTQRALRAATACLVTAVVASLTGCDGPVPIRGRIVWEDGSPAGELEGGQVMFRLPGAKSAIAARGLIGPGGVFTMSTVQKEDGVYPGTHLVAVVENRVGGGDSGLPLAPARLDPKFSDPDSSGLTVNVERRDQDVILTVGRKGR